MTAGTGKAQGMWPRAEHWLDAVDRCVLPQDPQAALQHLTVFIESTEQIGDHCWDDDFGMSELFKRAWTMAEGLAKVLPAEHVNLVLERLRGQI